MVHCLAVKLSSPFVAQHLGLHTYFQSVVLCITALGVSQQSTYGFSARIYSCTDRSLYPKTVFTFGIYNKMYFFSLLMFQPLYFGPLFCSGKSGFVGVFVHIWRKKEKKQNAVWSGQTQQPLILRDLAFNFLFSPFFTHKLTYLYTCLYYLEISPLPEYPE